MTLYLVRINQWQCATFVGNSYQTFGLATDKTYQTELNLTGPNKNNDFWSCHSVYRRQDVCVAKVLLWILSSCTYWWENRYPYPPLLHDGTTPHSWLMTPLPHTWLMTPLPILGWWPPHTWLMAPHSWLMTPLPILAWWPPHTWLMAPHSWLMPPHPYLADDPPILGWWPPIVGWWPPYPYLPDAPPPWLDDVLSQVGFSSVCVKAGPHETCAAGTSFHLYNKC